MATVEVAEVEVAAACVLEQERAALARPNLVERLERDRLQRDRASAQPRLRVLDPSVCIGPSDLDDAGGAIHVALFERERVEERHGVLVAVDCEMAVVEIDHRDARTHEP